MDVPEIIEGVKTIGISAMVILASFWFIKYMFDKFMDDREELDTKHKEEVTVLSESLQKVTEAVANNTVVMKQILERLRNVKDGN